MQSDLLFPDYSIIFLHFPRIGIIVKTVADRRTLFAEFLSTSLTNAVECRGEGKPLNLGVNVRVVSRRAPQVLGSSLRHLHFSAGATRYRLWKMYKESVSRDLYRLRRCDAAPRRLVLSAVQRCSFTSFASLMPPARVFASKASNETRDLSCSRSSHDLSRRNAPC